MISRHNNFMALSVIIPCIFVGIQIVIKIIITIVLYVKRKKIDKTVGKNLIFDDEINGDSE